MRHTAKKPQTFVEMALALLEDRFPWLGSDAPASGSEAVDQLNDLHSTLKKARATANRKHRWQSN